MKRAIQLGLLAIGMIVAGLFTAQPAFAANYSGNCAGVTAFNGSGNVDISDSACTLPVSITASGYIHMSVTSLSGSGKNLNAAADVSINASGGAIDIGNLQSGNGNIVATSGGGNITTGTVRSAYHVKLATTSGTITTSTVDSNLSGVGGNVMLSASGNIGAGAISTNGGTGYGAIEIDSNVGNATSTVFNVGGGGSNGTGTLNTTNTTGGGTTNNFIRGGVFVTNGNSSATGGITVNSMSDIQVTASSARSGIIVLQAQNGTLTLPTGSLTSDGPTSHGAGAIYLFADTITTADGTVVTASSGAGSYGTYHGVYISADTVNITGSSGLEIHGDGPGVSAAPYSAAVYLVPQGCISMSSNGDFQSMTWTSSFNNVFYTSQAFSVSGSNAPFTATANGSDAALVLSGYPISFTNGPVTLQSKGASDHQIQIGYFGTFTGSTGLSFSGTGAVSIDASGDGGDGGFVQIYVDEASVSTTSFEVKANGPSSGNGDGGQVIVVSSNLTLDSSSTATLSANAASSGTGNAILGDPLTGDPAAIAFYPGTANILTGTGAGQYSFSANGGTSGGNAGTIKMGTSGYVTIETADAFNASALGGNGDGGWIYIGAVVTVAADNTSSVNALGHGTGKGGRVEGYPTVTLNVNNIIKVDGGASAGIADFDGKITLNNVACQQWKTNNGSGSPRTTWPLTYWNCITTGTPSSPGTPSSLDTAPGELAGSTVFDNLRATFNGEPVHLYNFADDTDYQVFFYFFALPANSVGYTQGLGSGSDLYSAIFRTGTVGTYAVQNAKELTAHELGHAVNIINSNQSTDTTFQTYAASDFLFLDYTVVGASAGASTPRDPCIGSGAPFAGLTDEATGLPFCTTYSGTVPTGYTALPGSSTVAIESIYMPGGNLMRNSEIAQAASQIFVYDAGDAWRELYVQSLAYQAYVNSISPAQFYFRTADGILGNTTVAYFQCTQDWASDLIDANTVPPVSAPTPYPSGNGFGACDTVPAWYRTLLGH